jgi:prepilin-type N-terminal cleavage/methylation domain-containing protein
MSIINPKAPQRMHAFTLIELLIVIAIILILIAIALPNFMQAQVRAVVTRVKAEQRSYSTALEEYYQDFRAYPMDQRVYMLTTPVAYMAEMKPDPFAPADPGRFNFIHQYDPYYFIVIRPSKKKKSDPNLLGDFNVYTGYPSQWTTGSNDLSFDGRIDYQIRSIGPNKCNEYGSRYDPTNGTRSNGDLNWFGPFKIDRPYGPVAAP